MSLSDDVASLKVEVHKLAVAVEELAIRRYVEGEIDISKLPWFTPQYVPGDSIKLSNSRLPTATAYLDNKEVIASPIASFPNASHQSLGANQMFVEIPKPSPQGVYDIGQNIRCNHKESEQGAYTHQVFDTTPKPNVQASSSRSVIGVAITTSKTTNSSQIVGSSTIPCINLIENQALPTISSTTLHEVMVNNQVHIPEQSVGLLDKNLVVIKSHSEYKSVEESQSSSAQKVLDELPLPAFIKEMAQVASIVDEGIPMPEIAEAKTNKQGFEDNIHLAKQTQVQPDDELEYKRMMFTRLALLDGCFLHDLVIKGNLCLECPYFKVSIESFILLSNVHPLNFTKNVVRLSFLDDVDEYFTSRLSMVLDVKVSKPKVFELETDWRPILSFKEAHSWGIHASCWDCSLLDSSVWKLNSETRLAHIHTAMDERIWASQNMLNKSSLLTYIFYSSGSYWDLEVSDGYMTGFSAVSFAFFVDNMLLVMLVGSYTTKLTLIPVKPCSLLSNLILAFISCLTLGDKGDFEEVGNNMGLALQWSMSSLICVRNHLIINHTILMTFISFVFDPGGPYDKVWVATFINYSRVATSMECTAVWIFDPGGNDDLLGAMRCMSVSFIVHLEKISKALEHSSLRYVTELYLHLSLRIDFPSNYGNYFVLLLGYCSKSLSDTIFVFDPGGASGVNIVMLVSQMSSFKLLKGNLRIAIQWFRKIASKIIAIHVFDPGIMSSKMRRLLVLLFFFMPPTRPKVVNCFCHFPGIFGFFFKWCWLNAPLRSRVI